MSMDKTIGSTVKHQQQLKIGYKKQMKTCLRSPSWGLVLLCATFAFTVTITVVVWTTDLIKIALNENMGIENNTAGYDIWSNPPIYPIVQVYLFNYTNADAFAKGIDKKLRVQEVGPYVYREYTEKVNIVFHDNGTVSYQGKSSFSFVPELSVGHQPRHERVIMPNIPLLSALSVMKDNFLLAQIAFLAVARGLEAEQFVRVTAHDFMWGYDDPLFSAAATMGHAMPYKKFGILASRVGVRKDTVTMYTGKRNLQKLGMVTRFNGQERLRHWSGECNRIDGTDGTMFPPNLLDRNTTIYIFQGNMCRRLPLQYTEDAVILGGIPVLRYRVPRNTFDNPDVNPENACFCHQDVESCLPSGLFNASPCTFGAPVVMSFPHFYLGDPALQEIVDGLNPDPEKHDGYIDIHQELGVSLGGRSRLQFNMMVRKPSALNQLADFADGSVLPIAWFDTSVEDLPKEILSVVYHVTFTTRRVEKIMQYVLLAVSCALLYVLVRRFRNSRSPASNSDAGIVAPI
ncbi:scavenger receptor class B member 1-like [Periplaneta americana]|uniref:scavenger receptor class B member 1-like n=1 Tax=Periplaneta americana TaxID=6978 RepID=UPI0037E7E304